MKNPGMLKSAIASLKDTPVGLPTQTAPPSGPAIATLTSAPSKQAATPAIPESVAESTPQNNDGMGNSILAGLTTYKNVAQVAGSLVGAQPVTPDIITAPGNLGETFMRGAESGAAGMESDFRYFRALGSTLIGDKNEAAYQIRQARMAQAQGARAMAGIQGFEDFLKEPTFDGFLQQAVSSAGQLAPTAIESIAAALVTGGGAVLADAGLNIAGKTVAKKLLAGIIEKQAARQAVSATEKSLVDTVYNAFRKSTFGKGATAGAFGSEYATMSGESFNEFEDGGAPLDEAHAAMAAFMGVPEAAVGVGGEGAILKLFTKLPLKKPSIKLALIFLSVLPVS